jgi:SWI/SNF-related matrix-associated actin-dependent regulator 1 of chromatin subfamily A
MYDYSKLTDQDFEDIFKGHYFSVKPKRHQYITLVHTIDNHNDRVMFFHDIGTGKTLSALWTAELWKAQKILVVCPRSAFKAWKRDIRNHTNFTYTILYGEKEYRLDEIEKFYDIYIINYEGLKTIYGEMREKKVGKGREWKIKHKSFIHGFDCIVFDEVHKCKSYQSLQTKICNKLSYYADYAIGMTGTPIESNLMELWNLTKVVDLGAHLGLDFVKFRQNHFWNHKYDWFPHKNTEERILNKIAPITTSFIREDCVDLEKEIREVREVDPTPEQMERIEEVCSGLLMGEEINTSNVLTRSAKLRQIAGGFVYYKRDGEKKSLIFKQNNKLQALEDIIEETRGKIVVFHQYVEEAHIIEAWARKKKIRFASMRGEIKDNDEQYDLFIGDPNVKLLIAHPASASESYDLTISSVMVFYSSGYSRRERKQSEGRIIREGQEHKCVIIDIVVARSIDEIIAERIENKKELEERVLKFIREYARRAA